MESVFEILIWIMIVIFVFYISNSICFIRTAASLFISFLVAGLIVYLVYRNIFGEIMLILAFTIGLIYAIFRAVRDKRDDTSFNKIPM
jgi:hypothetical protein